MGRERLAVTLKSANIVKNPLAYWLVQAAKNPDKLRVKVVDQKQESYLLELLDEDGRATGGIMLADPDGSIHVDAAIDPLNEPMTKQRSFEEMFAARELALEREEQRRWYARMRDDVLYGVLPLVAVALILYLLLLFTNWVL